MQIYPLMTGGFLSLMLFFFMPVMLMINMAGSVMLIEWNIFSGSSVELSIPFILDPLGSLFSVVVILISFSVMLFSSFYMMGDKNVERFTILVILFVLSMNLLIFIPHMIILLLGWDGLGITSFILVIYYQNSKSLGAGMITAITNRIGDVLILICIGLMLNQGHWMILNIWEMKETLGVMIVIAAFTKSAQMPFSSWLPAAMAAPTPVSALVHSSTLVTAGVFLLIRFYSFLLSMPFFKPLVLFIGVSTLTMASFSACSECDMKKIIALSTLSQLGMMMSSLGLGAVSLTIFHMITHALFKALLFICAGNMIIMSTHSQDLRWMGNSVLNMPISLSCMLMSNMALCGFPFMSGFYSKDLIIEYSSSSIQSLVVVFLLFFSISMTTMYSLRFLLSSMWSPSMGSPLLNVYEDFWCSLSMLLLGSFAVFSGSMISWSFNFKFPVLFLSITMKCLILMMVLLGALVAFILIFSSLNMKMLHFFSCYMWNLMPLSTQVGVNLALYSSKEMFNLSDQAWLELAGSKGVMSLLKTWGVLSVMYMSIPQMFMILSFLFMMMLLIL